MRVSRAFLSLFVSLNASISGIAVAQDARYPQMIDDMFAGRDMGGYESFLEGEVRKSEEQYGPNSEMTASSLSVLAGIYRLQKKFEAAEAAYVRAIAIKEKLVGPNEWMLLVDLNSLAETYIANDKLMDAEKIYLRALQIAEKYPPDGSGADRALTNLARVYVRQGRFSEAEPLFKRALAIKQKAFSNPTFHVSDLINLADLYAMQGRHGEAEPFYRRSVELYDLMKDVDPMILARLYEKAAKTYTETGHTKDAQDLSERATKMREASRNRKPLPTAPQESSGK